MNKPTEAPHPFEFSLGQPAGLTALDIDVIKLTAQYTALNGREFLGGLAQREQRNPLFDFLKPTHVLFSYFTTLVDAYVKVANPTEELLQRSHVKSDRMKLLEAAVQRWEWTRAEEERKKRNAMEADAEKLAFQSIDWSDFTVVETIDFPENELLDVVGITGYGFGGLSIHGNTDERILDGDSGMDNGKINGDEVGDEEKKSMSVTAISRGLQRVKQLKDSADEGEEMEVEGHEDELVNQVEEDVDINVVSDYVPRVATGTTGVLTMIDPLTGKSVPVNEMGEHMRVQLIDPRWKIETQRFQEKQRETSYAEGASIADSLKRFAKKRTDIFSSGAGEATTSRSGGGNEDPSTKRGKSSTDDDDTQDETWEGGQPTPLSTSFPTGLPSAPPAPPVRQAFQPMQLPPPTMSAPQPQLQPFQPAMIPLPPTLPQTAPAPRMPLPTPPSLGAAYPPFPPSSVPFPPLPQQPMVGMPPSHPLQPLPPPMVPLPVPLPTPPSISASTHASSSFFPPTNELAAKFPNGITINVIVPNDSTNSNWLFNGQTLSVTLPVTATIKDLKEKISPQLGDMPTNKQQIKDPASGFLKDASTLVSLNISNGYTLELSAKTRGGRK